MQSGQAVPCSMLAEATFLLVRGAEADLCVCHAARCAGSQVLFRYQGCVGKLTPKRAVFEILIWTDT
jgi:hypothetical protein